MMLFSSSKSMMWIYRHKESKQVRTSRGKAAAEAKASGASSVPFLFH